jgi:hypothetical protein
MGIWWRWSCWSGRATWGVQMDADAGTDHLRKVSFSGTV